MTELLKNKFAHLLLNLDVENRVNARNEHTCIRKLRSAYKGL